MSFIEYLLSKETSLYKTLSSILKFIYKNSVFPLTRFALTMRYWDTPSPSIIIYNVILYLSIMTIMAFSTYNDDQAITTYIVILVLCIMFVLDFILYAICKDYKRWKEKS
jgi:hypothetical protein